MDIIDSFLMGLIQGLTEFLPISSSGHLVLARAMLSDQLQENITFEVVAHFGTLCSIIVYYRTKLMDIVDSLLQLAISPGTFKNRLRHDPNIKLSGYVLLSMIPAFVVAVTLKEEIETHFLNPFMVSVMLLLTGTILYATRFRKHHVKQVGADSSFAIGLAQAFAILPGISRSGSTISLGLYLGIKREEVANFSFLMVIPVIAGAMLLQLYEMVQTGIQVDAAMNLGVGFFAAFVSGYYALKYLIVMLKTKGIHPFAWYCWGLGIVGLYYFW